MNSIDQLEDDLFWNNHVAQRTMKSTVVNFTPVYESSVERTHDQEKVIVDVSENSQPGEIIDTEIRQVLNDLITRVREILVHETLEEIATQIAELRVMETSKYWKDEITAKSDIPYKRYLAVAALVHGSGKKDEV